MRDDVAFQSQQFAEQVAQRRDRYSQQMQDQWAQLPNAVTRYQQARGEAQRQQMAGGQYQMAQEAHQADMLKASSQLATDELHRQQAGAELQFANALHSTDMVALQKRQLTAQTEYEEARLAKMKDELGGEKMKPPSWDAEEIYTAMAMGMKGSPSGGRFVMTKATPEEQEMARKWLAVHGRDAVQERRHREDLASREKIASTYADQRLEAVQIASDQRAQAVEKNAATRIRVAEIGGQRKGELTAYLKLLDQEEQSIQMQLVRTKKPEERAAMASQLAELQKQRDELKKELAQELTGGDDFEAQFQASMEAAAIAVEKALGGGKK